MTARLAGVLATFMFAVVLVGCANTADQPAETDSAADWPDSSASESPKTSETEASETEASETEAESAQDIEPDPDGSYSHSCTYVLGDFTSTKNGYRFVADTHIDNTGNIGSVYKVTATWLLIGGDQVAEHKKVRVPAGETERVGFVHVATGDQIDRHQSIQSNDDACSVNVDIVDTFGEPNEE